MDSDTRTVRIGAYQSLRIDGEDTIALMSGDAPYVHIRTGSDAVRLPVGHCIPIGSNWASIVNPFPRPIEIIIARGIEPRFAAESSGMTAEQTQVTNSYYYAYRDTVGAPAGKKFALGFMMKRGEAMLYFNEQIHNLNSKVMFFPGARPDFMAFKPAGCMEEVVELVGSDGQPDTSAYMVGGYYDDSMVTAWIAASGYGSTPITVRHALFTQNIAAYRTATDVAVFYVRDADTGCHAYARMQHRGLTLEDLD